MTQAEWEACAEPTRMFDLMRDSARATGRKLRLFACACCRRIWPLMEDARSRMAVELAEGYADGAVGEGALREAAEACPLGADERGGMGQARWAALAAAHRGPWPPDARDIDGEAWRSGWAHAAAECAADYAARAAQVARAAEGHAAGAAERAAQAALLRDVFGPVPPRPLTRVDASWRAWNDGAVVKLAAAVYGRRDFTQLPLLADALEEAGCADADLLAHCRSGGEHVRGCWAVDLLLGKE